MKLSDILTGIDELKQKADYVKQSLRIDSLGVDHVDFGRFQALRTAILSFVKNIYGEHHPYYKEFEKSVHIAYSSSVDIAIEFLNSIQEEINGGWIFTTKGIVSAEIFSNFFEMAEHLLYEDYKDAAAVIIGSVLEEHLRQLCQKNSIEIEINKNGKKVAKKADQLNSDLGSNSVYNKLDQKNVTAWLDLRNNAAHGKYNEYTKPQVEIMHTGVLDFINRNSL